VLTAGPVVFLLDVDNTLLDNDRVSADLRAHLTSEIGEQRSNRYWELFEDLRRQLGYADYLGALQRYRVEHPRDPRVLEVSRFLVGYPFANRLYPGSLDAVAHARSFGGVAVLTDGDVVFQPRKIWRSGIYEAFSGNVLVYVHKERELEDVAERYPADHYVLVDDKVWILAAIKEAWGSRVTTIWPRQGHYALDEEEVARHRAPDLAIARIGDLVGLTRDAIVEAAS
jgi:FMN phosphatase YigB (HAD superfamily)